ncbi:MAG: ATP-binding protein [Bdellovibrionales bacterium]
MEKAAVRLAEGDLYLHQAEEIINKSRVSMGVLIALYVLLSLSGIYSDYPQTTLIVGLIYFVFVSLRFLHLLSFDKKAKKDPDAYFKVFRAFALITSTFWGILFAMVSFHYGDHRVTYIFMIGIFGLVFGGTNSMYADLKLALIYAATALVPAAIINLAGGSYQSVLGAGLVVFWFLTFKNTRIQNRYFWKSSKDRELLNTVFEALPSPMSIISNELIYERVNRHLADAYQLRPDEFIGKPVGFNTSFKDSMKFIEFLENTFQVKGKDDFVSELKIKQGEEIKHFYIVAAKFANGTKIACVSLDVTSEKQAEELIEQQRAIQLEASRLSSIGEMANSMAHEINNPLAIISGKTDQLDSLITSGKEKPEYIKKCIESIQTNVTRISKIIRSLRTVSGSSEESFQQCDLSEIVEDSLSLCRERMKSAGIQISIDLKAKEIEAHSSQLSQAILHLMSNSIEQITAHKCTEKWIKIESSINKEAMVEIVITDSGQGIPVEVANKMFQPFFSTKEIGDGVGLGLTVVRSIVQNHSGEIFVDNSAKNTCFTITVPLYQKAA